MAPLILIKLWMAHLIGDFLIQKDGWVKNRMTQGFKSPYLYLHIAFTALLSYLFVAEWQWWWLIPVVFTMHLLIDLGKIALGSHTLHAFMLDQFLHLLSLVLLWLFITNKWMEAFEFIVQQSARIEIWIVALAYLIILWPSGILIREFTSRWRTQIDINSGKDNGLFNAGKWIGYFERILVLTFILINQYAAIGFLIASKSILRLNPKDESRTKQFTEYILIGTLISFTITILLGLLINHLIISL